MFETVADTALHPRMIGAAGAGRRATIAVTPIAQPGSLAVMLANADQMHRTHTPTTGTLTGAISMMSQASQPTQSVTPAPTLAPVIARDPNSYHSGRRETRSMTSGANSTPSATTTTVTTTTTTTTDPVTNITTTTVTTTTTTTTKAKTIPHQAAAEPAATSSSSSTSSGESRLGFQGISYFHRAQVRKMLAAGKTFERIAAEFADRYTMSELRHLVRYYIARKQLDESELATVIEMRRIGASWVTVARHFERDVTFIRAAMRTYEESCVRPWSKRENRKLMETIAHMKSTTVAFWPTVTQRMKNGRHRFAPRDALTTKEHYEVLQEQSHNESSNSASVEESEEEESEFVVRKSQD